MEQQTKTCSKCNEVKSTSLFPKRSSNLDGLQNSCYYCKEKQIQSEADKFAKQEESGLEKFCYRCNTRKPIKDFSKRFDSEDGRKNYCRSCQKQKPKGSPRVLPPSDVVDLPNGTRVCTTCGIAKPLTTFRKAPTCKWGRGAQCKECVKKGTDAIRAARILNQPVTEGEKSCSQCKEIKNIMDFGIDRKTPDGRSYYCLVCSRERNLLWAISHPETVKEMRRRKTERERKDLNARIKQSLRASVKRALSKDQKKAGSATRDLGCSMEEFGKHIESLWQPGMNASNYGQFGWVIDHIMPLDAFDLLDREQLLEVCNYKNLRPLWWQDNLAKGSKMPWEFTQPLSSGPAPRPRERLKGRETAITNPSNLTNQPLTNLS